MDHVMPLGEDRHDDGSSAFGSAFFMAGSPEEAAHLAALRERFGDEMVDRLQRSWELMRHPRPLAGSERGVIREAFAPVLRDLRAAGSEACVPHAGPRSLAGRGPGPIGIAPATTRAFQAS